MYSRPLDRNNRNEAYGRDLEAGSSIRRLPTQRPRSRSSASTRSLEPESDDKPIRSRPAVARYIKPITDRLDRRFIDQTGNWVCEQQANAIHQKAFVDRLFERNPVNVCLRYLQVREGHTAHFGGIVTQSLGVLVLAGKIYAQGPSIASTFDTIGALANAYNILPHMKCNEVFSQIEGDCTEFLQHWISIEHPNIEADIQGLRNELPFIKDDFFSTIRFLEYSPEGLGNLARLFDALGYDTDTIDEKQGKLTAAHDHWAEKGRRFMSATGVLVKDLMQVATR